jgi:hypothetical protein
MPPGAPRRSRFRSNRREDSSRHESLAVLSGGAKEPRVRSGPLVLSRRRSAVPRSERRGGVDAVRGDSELEYRDRVKNSRWEVVLPELVFERVAPWVATTIPGQGARRRAMRRGGLRMDSWSVKPH